jgi:hypothetical protein
LVTPDESTWIKAEVADVTIEEPDKSSFDKARKEAMLIWQLWHKVVAVNMWRGCISTQVNQLCPMCDSGEKETVLHRFWSCEAA